MNRRVFSCNCSVWNSFLTRVSWLSLYGPARDVGVGVDDDAPTHRRRDNVPGAIIKVKCRRRTNVEKIWQFSSASVILSGHRRSDVELTIESLCRMFVNKCNKLGCPWFSYMVFVLSTNDKPSRGTEFCRQMARGDTFLDRELDFVSFEPPETSTWLFLFLSPLPSSPTSPRTMHQDA